MQTLDKKKLVKSQIEFHHHDCMHLYSKLRDFNLHQNWRNIDKAEFIFEEEKRVGLGRCQLRFRSQPIF